MKQRLDALTGLRFCAAAQVLLFHYGGALTRGGPAWLEGLRSSGYVAVSLFFVLSGFILACGYGDETTAWDGRRRFWARRFARIYPAYLVGLVAILPMALHGAWGAQAFGAEPAWRKLVTGVAHLGLVQAWLPQLATSWNLPGWSVCVEAFCYALFPFAAAIAARRLDGTKLAWAMAVLWAASVALALGYVTLDPDGLVRPTRESTGFWLIWLKFSPLVRAPEFLFGVCLGRWFVREPARATATWQPLAIAAAIVLVLASSARLPYPLLHNGLLVPLYGALILALARGGGLVGRVLATRPLVALGDASYGLYILQLPVMLWAVVLTGRDPRAPLDARFFAGYAAALAALSLVCFYLVEKPIQRVLRRRLEALVSRTPSPSALDPLYSGCTASSPAAPPTA